jgi:hypothetical protein
MSRIDRSQPKTNLVPAPAAIVHETATTATEPTGIDTTDTLKLKRPKPTEPVPAESKPGSFWDRLKNKLKQVPGADGAKFSLIGAAVATAATLGLAGGVAMLGAPTAAVGAVLALGGAAVAGLVGLSAFYSRLI